MEITGVPTICILGDAGAGKTRLSATFPDAFLLDLEEGGGSAYDNDHRTIFRISSEMLRYLNATLDDMHNCTYENKRLVWGKIPVGAVVIDSIDALQQVHKYMSLNPDNPKYKYNPRGLWGDLLDDLTLLVFKVKALPVPTIFIAHNKIVEPVLDNAGNFKKDGFKALATQGSIEEQMKRWFDYILHLTVVEENKRICFTQPTIYQHYKITAKDRHNLFKTLLDGKESFPVAVDENGYPVTKAMTTIYESHIY